MKYALNLAEDGRVLSITKEKYAPINAVLIDEKPEGNVADYLYMAGELIYSPMPEEEVSIPTWQDRIEAQVTYTAIVTDSLLPEKEEEI